MRLHITNNNDELLDLVYDYLSALLIDKRVDFILNGDKTTGTIKELSLNKESDPYLSVFIGSKEFKVPLFEETEGRFGKELVVFQTNTSQFRNHSTVIEILD